MIPRPLVTAFRTLTAVPIPGKDTNMLYQSLPWFALVGLFIGSVHLLAFDWIKYFPQGFLRYAGIAICGLNYLITGALHLDGLADTADAFGTKRDKESTLKILKDSHIGVFGTSAVVFAILWRTIVYQQLIEQNALIWILYALCMSRIVQGLQLSVLPYGRDKTGKAHPFAGPTSLALLLVVELFAVGATTYWLCDATKILVPFTGGSICVILVSFMFLKRIGGITGDGVGASSELFELMFLTGILL